VTEQTRDETGNDAIDLDLKEGRAPGSFGEPDERIDRQGGINQGTTPENLTPEQYAEYQRRRALGDAVDDNAASHQGGIGAQGGASDFGSSGNLAGGFGDGR
jgi:hypothetical protein